MSVFMANPTPHESREINLGNPLLKRSLNQAADALPAAELTAMGRRMATTMVEKVLDLPVDS